MLDNTRVWKQGMIVRNTESSTGEIIQSGHKVERKQDR